MTTSESEVLAPDATFTVLEELATCMCAQFIAAGLPPHCFCGVVPGQEAAYDYAGDCDIACGMAWVRLITSYPSVIVATPYDQPNNCGAMLGIEVEMGSVRCVPGLDNSGNPPAPADLLASAQLQSADMMAMRRAIACCSGSRDFLVGSYQPIGPEGGLVGGFWSIAIQVN